MDALDAFFNVYKPRGPTSHDVVARLRRASGVRRIGHAGTLDPLAEGVLVVAIGKATRLIEYLVDADKLYGAWVRLGVETDTDDAEGRVLAERPVGHIGREAVAEALEAFRGEIEQRPPPFSAVSVGGERLYARARRGEVVEAPLRRVNVTRLDLLDWQPPVAHLEVECSKGTYIRSLAHDLGRALGCGAHLSGLVRLRVGDFRAQDAVPLEDLEGRLREGRWEEVARPPAVALAHLPRITLDERGVERLRQGQPVPAPEQASLAERAGLPEQALPSSGTLGGAFGPGEHLVAVVRLDRGSDHPVWRPEKVLAG
jgi:tRNA pseudouridine55 synthase